MKGPHVARAVLHLLMGCLFVAAAYWGDYLVGRPVVWQRAETLVAAAGVAVMVFGLLPLPAVLSRVASNVCISVLTFTFLFALCEVAFRVIGFDFAKEEQSWRRSPPYFRQPVEPTGEAFFRRPGPEAWTGQVLNTQVRLVGVTPNPYLDEPVVTVSYNRLGFRNPEGLTDWEIAIAGDSFTELGYLKDEDLFTHRLGQMLGLRVLNLGTTFTGPLTQLSYLRDYGIAPSTRRVIIVFFEGNDLTDLEGEYAALVHWQRTGQREYRRFQPQTSALKAVYRLAENWERQRVRASFVDAYFRSANGDVPVSLTYAPPGRSELSREALVRLEYFFSEYEKLGATRKVDLSLVYMPSKTRVLQGLLRFTPDGSPAVRTWVPSDLPELIGELCARHRIRFMDLTPRFVDYTNATRTLLFNSVFDSHLTIAGSDMVAKFLAFNLREDRRLIHAAAER